MKALVISLGILAASTVGYAQQWANTISVPYLPHQVSDEDPNEGKVPLGKDEIPLLVLQSFEGGPFQHMEIVQAFRLQDRALQAVVLGEGPEQPLFLYELRLIYDGRQSCLYFTPNGELYEGSQVV